MCSCVQILCLRSTLTISRPAEPHTHTAIMSLLNTQQAIYMTRDLFTLLRVNAALGRGTKHTAEGKIKKEKTKEGLLP